MTELIYFEDSYTKEFDAKVKETKENRVILDKTAFYPQGGGQPSDTGKIEGIPVKMVEKKSGEVEHILGGKVPETEKTVHCVLNWNRRYSHMKYHTAQHILSAVVLDEYDAKTTGNQIHQDKARIDFDTNIFDEIEKIEEIVNSVINDRRNVKIYTMARNEAMEKLNPERTRIDLLPDSIKELRIVEIENLDKTACAGTHVKNTGELGKFKVTETKSKGKERKRIEFGLQ